jgi:hypothetical protein
MASRQTIIQDACDAIVRTPTITSEDCDALAVSLIAKNAELVDPTVYDAAFISINAIAVSLGASTYGQVN